MEIVSFAIPSLCIRFRILDGCHRDGRLSSAGIEFLSDHGGKGQLAPDLVEPIFQRISHNTSPSLRATWHIRQPSGENSSWEYYIQKNTLLVPGRRPFLGSYPLR